MLGVDQRELSGNVHVGTGHRAGALGRDGGRSLGIILGQGREHQALYIEDDVGNVLDDAFGGGELVLHALDLNGGSLRTVQGGQQNATHAVAKRVAEATLQRLNDEARDSVVHFFGCDGWPHELCHSL